jgi:cell division control protein 6
MFLPPPSAELQKDRIVQVLSTASYHLKLACAELARVAFLTGQDWHSTSTIYDQYCRLISNDTKPLGYRRVSELLADLENTGLVLSQTSSKGRHGYGTQYKLAVTPDMVGNAVSSEWWKDVVKAKLEHDVSSEQNTLYSGTSKSMKNLLDTFKRGNEMTWKSYVGLWTWSH